MGSGRRAFFFFVLKEIQLTLNVKTEIKQSFRGIFNCLTSDTPCILPVCLAFFSLLEEEGFKQDPF